MGLRAAGFPYRSGLLTGVGMALMGIALAGRVRPLSLVGIGVTAALVNLLVVPVLHVSVTCKANACLAIVLESAGLGAVAALLTTRVSRTVYTRMLAGGAGALLASGAFYFLGTRLAPCDYLLSFATPMTFVVKEGLVWAAFSAVLFPIGYLAGERLAVSRVSVAAGRALYYAGSGAIVTLCWAVSALVIAAGV